MKIWTTIVLVGACSWGIGLGPVALGQAQPQKKIIKVASPVKGIIAKVLVKEGDAVKVGQLLVQIDDRLAEVELMLAQAKVGMAKAELAKAEMLNVQSMTDFDRAKQLMAKIAISQAEFNAVKTAWEVSTAEVKIRLEALQLAKLGVEKAQIIHMSHRVMAPTNGVVFKVQNNVGEGVKELATVVEIAVDGK